MQKLLRSPFLVSGAAVLLALGVTAIFFPGLFTTLFSPGFFMPHSHCYLDNPRMIWLHGLSDFLIGVSYMVIAAALGYLVWKARRDLPYEWMFLAFGVFIFSCGWTHFMEVWTLWHPIYWLSGSIKAVTAIASVATAIGIFIVMPRVFTLIQTAKVSEQRRLDLAKAHQELELSFKGLEAFSYSLSHDIRAPLRAVRTFTAMALEEHRQQLGNDGVALLERALGGAGRMNQLVEDVLALSRMSREKVQTQNLDTEALIHQIIVERPDLQAPRAEVRIEGPLPQVVGDTASFTQCLTNLLSNAVKFVAAGVTPKVRIWAEERIGGLMDKWINVSESAAHASTNPPTPSATHQSTNPPIHSSNRFVRLWIEDNGIGIPPEANQKIFEAFQRLHGQNEYEGTGIGLAIVRKAAERMGGQVGVESEPGKGSRFWVELPAAATAA